MGVPDIGDEQKSEDADQGVDPDFCQQARENGRDGDRRRVIGRRQPVEHREDSGLDAGKFMFAEQLPHHKDAYKLSTQMYPELVNEVNAWMVEKADFVKELRAKWGIEMHN